MKRLLLDQKQIDNNWLFCNCHKCSNDGYRVNKRFPFLGHKVDNNFEHYRRMECNQLNGIFHILNDPDGNLSSRKCANKTKNKDLLKLENF